MTLIDVPPLTIIPCAAHPLKLYLNRFLLRYVWHYNTFFLPFFSLSYSLSSSPQLISQPGEILIKI